MRITTMEAAALSSRASQHSSAGGLGALRDASVRPRAPRRSAILAPVCSHREFRPFARPVPTLNGSSPLPQSLYSPQSGEIPEEGQFLTKREATCDPEERYCQDPYYVYESDCKACFGTGAVRSRLTSRRNSRSTLSTCLQCNGLGVVRRTTTRFFPGDDGDTPMTVARTPAPPATEKNPTIKRKPPSYYRPRTKPSTNGTAQNGSSRASSSTGAEGNGNGAAGAPEGQGAVAAGEV